MRIAVVGLVSAAAIGINPYGPSMLLYPFRTVGIGVLRDYIQEWAAPDFHLRATWPFIWLLLGTLAMAGLSRKRLDWQDAISVGGTAYSALLAGRNIPTFAIAAAPVLSEHASVWLADHGYRLNWNRTPSGIVFSIMNWVLLIAVLVGVFLKSAYALNPDLLTEARKTSFPVDAVEFLQAENPPGPLFNNYNWGGYLIWEARDYPVYVDGRTDLYDDELLQVYLATYSAQSGWEDHLDEAGINLVLIETNSPLAGVLDLSSGWLQIYQDELAVIYSREDTK